VGLSAARPSRCCAATRTRAALAAIAQRHAEELAMGVERAAAVLESSARATRPLRALWLCGGGRACRGSPRRWRRGCACRSAPPTRSPAWPCATGAFDGLDADAIAPLLMLPLGLALRRAA
jgi:type IV pilus assembly protein PilM